MHELRRSILDSLQATDIILVFVTTFFSLRYPDIVSVLEEDIPKGTIAVQRYKKKLRTSLYSNCLIPLTLSCFLLVFCAPLAIKVIRSRDFELLSIDPLPGIFMLVLVWLLLMVVIWGELAHRTWKKLIHVKQGTKGDK